MVVLVTKIPQSVARIGASYPKGLRLGVVLVSGEMSLL
jgi:hypothetical protein